ncbi:MAG: alpha/beta fold hydrolase [Gemmatimonadota bacterium]|nr:alpha/beta fold hydrolase [Gemmatimonadota bacterium]
MRAGTALGLAAGLVAAGWAWTRAMTARNVRLRRPPALDAAGRPWPVTRFRFADGAEVDLIVAGRGPVLLLVPGADGMKETWRHQLPAFAARYRVLAADVRSTFGPDDTFDRLAADAVELLDAHGADTAAVVGQSLGGAVAMRLAARRPERVRALVVANSLARVSYEHVGPNRTLLAPLAMATTRYLPTPLARAAARMWSRADAWIFDSSPGSERVVDYALWTGPRTERPSVSARRVDLLKRADLRPELPSIRAPTLVVKGPRDAYTPPSWARAIAAAIPGARYEEVPGTGHCSHISMPEAFNALVLDWLAANDPAGGEESA